VACASELRSLGCLFEIGHDDTIHSMLTDPAILERVIDPKRGGFSASLARQVLKFTFLRKDLARYEKLSYKARDGTLSAPERAELEDYLNVNDLLMILKAKAEASLRDQTPAA
jgi:hypothetical protein